VQIPPCDQAAIRPERECINGALDIGGIAHIDRDSWPDHMPVPTSHAWCAPAAKSSALRSGRTGGSNRRGGAALTPRHGDERRAASVNRCAFDLVHKGLATATPESVHVGKRPIEVVRVQISDAGRLALAG